MGEILYITAFRVETNGEGRGGDQWEDEKKELIPLKSMENPFKLRKEITAAESLDEEIRGLLERRRVKMMPIHCIPPSKWTLLETTSSTGRQDGEVSMEYDKSKDGKQVAQTDEEGNGWEAVHGESTVSRNKSKTAIDKSDEGIIADIKSVSATSQDRSMDSKRKVATPAGRGSRVATPRDKTPTTKSAMPQDLSSDNKSKVSTPSRLSSVGRSAAATPRVKNSEIMSRAATPGGKSLESASRAATPRGVDSDFVSRAGTPRGKTPESKSRAAMSKDVSPESNSRAITPARTNTNIKLSVATPNVKSSDSISRAAKTPKNKSTDKNSSDGKAKDALTRRSYSYYENDTKRWYPSQDLIDKVKSLVRSDMNDDDRERYRVICKQFARATKKQGIQLRQREKRLWKLPNTTQPQEMANKDGGSGNVVGSTGGRSSVIRSSNAGRIIEEDTLKNSQIKDILTTSTGETIAPESTNGNNPSDKNLKGFDRDADGLGQGLVDGIVESNGNASGTSMMNNTNLQRYQPT